MFNFLWLIDSHCLAVLCRTCLGVLQGSACFMFAYSQMFRTNGLTVQCWYCFALNSMCLWTSNSHSNIQLVLNSKQIKSPVNCLPRINILVLKEGGEGRQYVANQEIIIYTRLENGSVLHYNLHKHAATRCKHLSIAKPLETMTMSSFLVATLHL